MEKKLIKPLTMDLALRDLAEQHKKFSPMEGLLAGQSRQMGYFNANSTTPGSQIAI